MELQDATDFETNKDGSVEERTKYDPESDEDLYGSIFGNDEEATPETSDEQQPVHDLDSGEEVGLGEAPDLDGDGVPDSQQKPFGDEGVTEDEATDEAQQEG